MKTNKYLFAHDFDGTIAMTFEKSPAGIGVNEAYGQAITDIFGQRGLDIYNTQGELKNRAPSEVVKNILEGDNESLLGFAKFFLNQHIDNLNKYVPKGKGVPLVWDEEHPERFIGELLVRQKLHYLMDKVGTKFPNGSSWPRPCKGFIEYWQTIEELKKQGIYIDTAIISSGHDLFIDKVFKLWNLSRPDILVTEDDIRGRLYPKELERRTKPGELQLALAHQEWLKNQKLTREDFDIRVAEKTRDRMIYFGDDVKKDGGLAQGANIPFGLFNPEGQTKGLQENAFVIRNWSEIATALTRRQGLLREGRPIRDLFLYRISGKETIGRDPERA